ncbi:hypothetical protein MIR68_008504 [Amoeboaphelidium protococcarum]|nr:hypothetical protein MIR68_008504 [Amoeboaphelidium protococcarum]
MLNKAVFPIRAVISNLLVSSLLNEDSWKEKLKVHAIQPVKLGVLVEVEDKRAADVLRQVYGDIQELSNGLKVFYTGAFEAGAVDERTDSTRTECDKNGWEVVEIKSVVRWYLFTKYKKTVRSNELIILVKKRDLKM